MIIGEITPTYNLDRYVDLNRSLYYNLQRKYKKIQIISCHKLIYKNSKILNKNIKNQKYINLFEPKTYLELENYLEKNKDLVIFNNISPKFYHFRIFYSLSKFDNIQLSLNNMGNFSSYKTENWKNVNISKKIYFLYLKKMAHLAFRILTVFNIFKQIDIHFETRLDLKKSYQNGMSYKIKKMIPFFKTRFKIIKKISLRNSQVDKIKLKNSSAKYITFLDEGFVTGDAMDREDNNFLKNKDKYYLDLKIYLRSLQKILQKRIIICVHPVNDLNFYKSLFKEFYVCKYRTDHYIQNSYLCVFHNSSAIVNALLLNKKIICIQSKLMSKFAFNRTEMFRRLFSFVNHDMHQLINADKKKLIKQLLLKSKKNINEVKKYYHIDPQENFSETIFNEVNKIRQSNS